MANLVCQICKSDIINSSNDYDKCGMCNDFLHYRCTPWKHGKYFRVYVYSYLYIKYSAKSERIIKYETDMGVKPIPFELFLEKKCDLDYWLGFYCPRCEKCNYDMDFHRNLNDKLNFRENMKNNWKNLKLFVCSRIDIPTDIWRSIGSFL